MNVSLAELQGLFATLHPQSFVQKDGAAFWAQAKGTEDRLALLARPDDPSLNRFEGETSEFKHGHTIKFCALNHANAQALRNTLPWLRPELIGLATSAGLGDRLGLATPGHVRAVRKTGTIVPIFAQQSIREMQRTGRTPEQVLDDATWGAFREGWHGKLGADADHLKTPADIDACVAAGFSFYTIDPGAYVDSEADTASPAVIEQRVRALPWNELESNATEMTKRYAGQRIDLESKAIETDKLALLRATAKYGHAIAHIAMMYRHLATKGIPFELEISVDETETPTSHVEHIYIARELKRLGVKWISLAPRYIGRFEKGVDYIGDLRAFEDDFAIHAEIARCFGPYKLSLHSGSDKFSIYGAAARQTRGMVHLKTAGTSYLEALRTIATLDPKLFRAIYAFARERYETDRASYHVSAHLERAPVPERVSDSELAALLGQFDARQILHVTFGSVLTARDANGHFRFYDTMMTLLRAHPDAYAENLEKHFARHLKPFAAA